MTARRGPSRVFRLYESAQADFGELVSLRRFFHQNPEPGFREFRTSAKIEEKLGFLGVRAVKVRETGVIGVIEGDRPGRVVGLRADMDALELEEGRRESFRSQVPGMMHACGHDAHVAMLLGAARLLAGVVKRDRGFEGKVLLIFQPAEELDAGAEALLESVELDSLDACFALHVVPDLPVGALDVQPGPRMAGAAHFKIGITGRTAHGAAPHQGTDAVLAASSVVLNLQTVVSRETDPAEALVVSVGTLAAGTRFNIIAGRAELAGTIRAYDQALLEATKIRVGRVVRGTCDALGASAEITFTEGCPVLVNDERLARLMADAVRDLPSARLIDYPRMMASEDFANYARVCPIAMGFLGAGPADPADRHPLHDSMFTLDEAALPYGATLLAASALSLLDQP